MVWPFNRNAAVEKTIPSVTIGNVSVFWRDGFWSFVDTNGEYDFTLYENAEFHDSILEKIPAAKAWINDLKPEINKIIDEHVGDWGLERDDRSVVGIDVSNLAEENQIDVAFGCEQWADYGVNIVITNGKITESYGGD